MEKNNFRNFQTLGKPSFQTFGKPSFQTFRTFPNFFQTFWPKNRVYQLKNSNFTYFFWNFLNLHTFLNKSELFSELKFPNFFPNFFVSSKIPFFPKNSELRQLNFSETGENKKFGKSRLMQGPSLFPLLSRREVIKWGILITPLWEGKMY